MSLKILSTIALFALCTPLFADTNSGTKTIDLFNIDPRILLGDGQVVTSNTPVIKKREEYPDRWIVAEFDGIKITNKDLERFIEMSKLTDSRKIQLFMDAQKDFDKYTEAKDNWVYSWWRPALKQFLYFKILEKEAQKQGRNRQAFTVSKNALWEMQENSEHEILKSFLDQGKGIRFARDEYAKFLVENNFPHQAGASLQDIYFDWKKVQDDRLKESLRVREVSKFEYLTAHPKAQPNYFASPTAIYNLNQEARNRIQTLFSKTNLNDTIISEELKKYPVMSTLLKKIHTFSLKETSLKTFYTKDFNRYQEAKENFNSFVARNFNEQKINRIAYYESLALRFAQEFDSVEKLEEASKKSLDAFLAAPEGDYQHFMLARLYDLAATLLKTNPDRETILTNSLNKLKSSLEKIKGEIANDYFYTSEHSDIILPELFAKRFLTLMQPGNDQDSYEYKLKEIMSWVLKFDIKRLISTDRTTYEPEIRDYNKFEAQQHLEAFWLDQEFNKNLREYQTRTLKRKYRHSFMVNPDGEYRLRSNDAIDFIFE